MERAHSPEQISSFGSLLTVILVSERKDFLKKGCPQLIPGKASLSSQSRQFVLWKLNRTDLNRAWSC